MQTITKFFRERREQKETQKNLMEFYAQMKKNLESYHVMDQLGKLRFFAMDSWENIKTNPPVAFKESVLNYSQRLEQYNQQLKNFKDYEQWYTSNVSHKNKENAQVLHAKNAQAKQQFQGLEEVITSAIKDLELQLYQLKILKL